ncbi:MAG: HD domain-containing protein [Gemmatimonadota bacterium]|nr:HD domain-containing protein [Gemmatimonadota bacterium]
MSQDTYEAVLHAVLGDAGTAVLEARPDGSFRVVSSGPEWFTVLVGPTKQGDIVDLGGRCPPLDHFMLVARDHWAHGSTTGIESSGIWIEMVGDQEIPLEAYARRIEGRPHLILSSPARQYDEVRGMLQHARESLLSNGVLERAVEERTQMIRAREEEIAVRLVSAAEFRDSATGAHIRRIGRFTLLVATAMRLHEHVLDHLELAASMHDVGKIGIPDHILLKPGPLDEEERRVMERHTVVGARILEDSDTPALQLGREIALSHHERWDGTGYPFGLSGEQIPLVARIVAIVDYFDATVNDRPYRPAMSVEEVLGIMRGERERHFDPAVLDLFLHLQPQIAEIRRAVDLEVAEERALAAERAALGGRGAPSREDFWGTDGFALH